MRAANDGLRFLLELSALAAVAYWGWSEHGGIWRWVLVVAAPLAVAALWGNTIAPKAKRRVGDPWRLVVELLVFGGAVAALLAAGQPTLAIVLGAAVLLHLALTFVLGQRGSR
jgi:anti-sigma-K factor RskA